MLPDNVPLPDLPALLGPSNLDHWSDVLHGLLAQMDHKEHLQYTFPGPQPEDLGLEIDDDDHALDRKIRKRRTFLQDGQNINPHVEGSCGGDWYQRTHDLESYLDNRLYPDSRFTHDDLRNWRLKGSRIVLLIKASLEKVRQYLIASGWKPQVNTVKYHYDFIMHEIPKMGKVDGKSVQSNAGTVVSGGWSSAFIHEDCLIKTLTPVEIVKKMANLKQSSAPCGKSLIYAPLLPREVMARVLIANLHHNHRP